MKMIDDIQEEVWKIIPDHPNFEASNFGRIRGMKRTVNNNIHGGVRTIDSRIRKQFVLPNGYHTIVLYYKSKTLYVHRLIAETFLDNPTNLPQVNHKDGIKSNNSLINLEWCTAKENINHAHKLGIMRWGKNRKVPI